MALSVPLGLVALAYGTRLAHRELQHPPRQLVIPAGDAAATLDGTEMHALRLHWRGPMVLVAWRDSGGRRRYLPGWPDNIDAAARRELRLAIAARMPARAMRSMAP